MELRILRFLSKMVQLGFREVRFFITPKRDVKLTAQVVTAQTVVTRTVQKKKQHRATQRFLAKVELIT